MRKGYLRFQIGKNGITDGLLENLDTAFKKHRSIRVSVLKNLVRNKKKVQLMAEQIKNNLNRKVKYNIIGFTIIFRRSKE